MEKQPSNIFDLALFADLQHFWFIEQLNRNPVSFQFLFNDRSANFNGQDLPAGPEHFTQFGSGPRRLTFNLDFRVEINMVFTGNNLDPIPILEQASRFQFPAAKATSTARGSRPA